MKFAGARGITRSRVPLIAMLALAATIGLAGCEGDDGKDGLNGTNGTNGATGATGPVGPTGPTGPAGPTGPSAKVEPRESCGVCHADGSAYGVAESHAVSPDIAISDLKIAPSATVPADLVVSFNVKAAGANFTTFTRVSAAHRFDGTNRDDLTAVDAAFPGDAVRTLTRYGWQLHGHHQGWRDTLRRDSLALPDPARDGFGTRAAGPCPYDGQLPVLA